MIPRNILKIVIVIYGVIFPVYRSHKALKNNETKDIQRWLTYWMIFVPYVNLLDWIDILVRVWLPFYNELNLLMLLWLLNSELKGSRFLYDSYLKPFLSNHETEIESSIHKIGSSIIEVGLKISSKLFHLVGSVVLELLNERNSGDIKDESSTYRYEIDKFTDFGKLYAFLTSSESSKGLKVENSSEKPLNERCGEDLPQDSNVCLSQNKRACKRHQKGLG